MSALTDFEAAVLAKIGAPVTPSNLDIMTAWSAAEKPAGQPLQWNNPWNTTQYAPGSINENSVGVKAYPDIATGVDATARTLQNGYYPNLLADLRASAPASTFQANANKDLGTWGTGVGWLARVISGSGGTPSPAPSTSAAQVGFPGLPKGWIWGPGGPMPDPSGIPGAAADAVGSVAKAVGDAATSVSNSISGIPVTIGHGIGGAVSTTLSNAQLFFARQFVALAVALVVALVLFSK